MSLPGLTDTDPRTVIITQGPLAPEGFGTGRDDQPDHAGFGHRDVPDTGPHFWRMCHSERVGAVAMLCQAQRGFTGCAEYYPSKERPVVQWDGGKVKCRTT